MVEKLGDDLIWGAAAIAKETGLTRRQAYYQLEAGLLPAGRIGEKWVASRRTLREHFAKIMSGANSSAPATAAQ